MRRLVAVNNWRLVAGLAFEQLLNLVAGPLLQQSIEQVCGLGRQDRVVDCGDVLDTLAQFVDVAVGHRVSGGVCRSRARFPNHET